MLSDRGIKEYIEKGLLKVSPMSRIGPASIDLHIGDQLYQSDEQAHIRHGQEVDALAGQGNGRAMMEKIEEPLALSFDQYVARFGKRLHETDGHWFLEPNARYYSQTAENIAVQKGVRIWVATRSSSARNGFRVQYSEEKLDRCEEFEGNPELVIETFGTSIQLPKNHRVCQMVVEPSRYLFTEEVEKALKNNDIAIVGGNPVIVPDSAILTFHSRLLRYNGKLMNPAEDSSECFEEVDITHGYFLEAGRFYLGSTQETVGIGRKHVGVLHEFGFGLPLDSYNTHLNAAYHWPGSDHSITLEIFSRTPRFVKAGDPACRLFFQELYPECEFPYNSRYNGQDGPTVSRGNLKQ